VLCQSSCSTQRLHCGSHPETDSTTPCSSTFDDALEDSACTCSGVVTAMLMSLARLGCLRTGFALPHRTLETLTQTHRSSFIVLFFSTFILQYILFAFLYW
jgi:hypothetical protein